MRLATLLAGDVQRGEDLLQTVFVSMYPRWAKGQPPADPAAYARAALVNAARRSWRRRASRRETLVAEPPDADAPPDATDLPLRAALLAALRTLPPRQRAVVAFRYFDGYSEAETAELLHCSVGTVKAHAHRALRRLRADPELASYLYSVVEA